MATVTVRTTRTRTTVKRWCASCLTTCVLPTTPSVCLLRSCVMALTIVRMALMRNFVVWHSLRTKDILAQTTTWKCVAPQTSHTTLLSRIYSSTIIYASRPQTYVHWTTVAVATTAPSFPGRASCVPVPWAWSWELIIRPARSRASVPNTSNVARSVSRRNPASSAPAMRAGSWSLTWRAAKALVIKKGLCQKEFIYSYKLKNFFLASGWEQKYFSSCAEEALQNWFYSI